MDNQRRIGFWNYALLGLLFVMTIGCEGPVGPPGPPGLDGVDGFNFVGEVFEIEGDFTQEGNFGLNGEYGFEILPSDKVLVYRLSYVNQDGIDVWTALPQIVFHEEGVFTYGYDFTLSDYSIFMEGNFDLNMLDNIWTDAQVFRVLIIPADFIVERMDFTDHDAVVETFDIDLSDIPRFKLN